MAKVTFDEITKRGICQYKVELDSGEVYLLGFDTDAPQKQEPYFSFTLGNILSGYSKVSNGNLFSFISRGLASNNYEMPLYLMPDSNEERIRVCSRIRNLREEKKMEAKRLAQITDIDAANLSRIEQGKFSPGLDTLCKIATALDAYIDILSNNISQNNGNGFSLRKKVWVLPANGYCPIAPVPAFGACFWPSDECKDFQSGDLVVFSDTNSEPFGPIFTVTDTFLSEFQLPVNAKDYKPWPRESDFYTKLSYRQGVTQEIANRIIDLCKRRFKTMPTEATLLDVSEVGL